MKLLKYLILLIILYTLDLYPSDFCEDYIAESTVERILFESLEAETKNETENICFRKFFKNESESSIIIELERYNLESVASAKLATDRNVEAKVEKIDFDDYDALYYTNFNQSELTIEILVDNMILKVTTVYEDVDDKEMWMPQDQDQLLEFSKKLIDTF